MKVTVLELVERFGRGKTQVHGILRNKDSIMESLENNDSRQYKRKRKEWYAGVNDSLFEWYQLAVSKNACLS